MNFLQEAEQQQDHQQQQEEDWDLLPATQFVHRQYTGTTDDDYVNSRNGLCPDHALRYGIEANTRYWPEGHNFIDSAPRIGHNSIRPELYARLSRKMQLYIANRVQYAQERDNTVVFCELDNVLTDFNGAIEQITGNHPMHLSQAEIKTAIDQTPGFYTNLKFPDKGQVFWSDLQRLNTRYTKPNMVNEKFIKPVLLIDEPGNAAYREEITQWCRRNLGQNIKITAISNLPERDVYPDNDCYIMFTSPTTKHSHAIFNSVLIASKDKNNIEFARDMWETNDGIFCEYSEEDYTNILTDLRVAFDI